MVKKKGVIDRNERLWRTWALRWRVGEMDVRNSDEWVWVFRFGSTVLWEEPKIWGSMGFAVTINERWIFVFARWCFCSRQKGGYVLRRWVLRLV